jgi:hypothetical protein
MFDHTKNHCVHYNKGKCKFGNKCRKSHDFTPEKQIEKKHKNKRNHRKNTESFEPDNSPPDMRLLVAPSREIVKNELSERDVIIIPDFFEDKTLYNRLLDEMNNCGFESSELWKLWHGDSHFIADDRLGNWKEKCPTFMRIIDDIANFFDMDVKATRFNLYNDNTEWKPYHRDAAAIKPDKARTQNITVALSLGATRSASFQHMKTKTRIDIPLPDRSVYVFNKQVNIDWMHGIIQEPELKKEGRISIILWGKCNQMKCP